MFRSNTAIVIPAYNEAQSIFEVIEQVKVFGLVIVVNDFSYDDTATVAKSAGAIVINHENNKGYDEALNSGMKKAFELGCDFVVTFDADGQHTTERLQVFLDALEEGTDLVLGVRPKTARITEWLFAKESRLLWGIRDPLCGMKGYNMKLWRDNHGFDHCQSIGSELAIQSVRKGASFVQIDIPILEREYGTPRFGHILKANWRILLAMLRVTCLRK